MSSPAVERIRAALVPWLQEHPIRWWTAYSLWGRICDIDPETQRLILDRHGEAVGEGGEAHTGPVHGISHILGHGYTAHVVDDKLECSGMVIHSFPVSPNRNGVAMFRWQE